MNMNIQPLITWCKGLEDAIDCNNGRGGAVTILLYTDFSYRIGVEYGGQSIATISDPGELDDYTHTVLEWQLDAYAAELTIVESYLKNNPRPVIALDT